MILLLDIGKSRTKWAVLNAGALATTGARPHGGAAEILPADIPVSPDQVYAANVAGPRAAEALQEAVRARWGCAFTLAHTSAALGKVRNGYKETQQLGVDRWLAILAAYERVAGAVCVVDAGTATTVDLVAADGVHLGGYILPGVDLMLESLKQATGDLARLAEVASAQEGLGPGDSTGKAMRHGAWLATAGLVREAGRRLPAGAATVVTGGRGRDLAGFLAADYDEWLVLKGLALSWRAGASA